jgi:hypothetical protein
LVFAWFLLFKISAGGDLADFFPLKTRWVGTIGAGFPISRRPLGLDHIFIKYFVTWTYRGHQGCSISVN